MITPSIASPLYSPGKWRPRSRKKQRFSKAIRLPTATRTTNTRMLSLILSRAASFSMRMSLRKVSHWVIQRTRTYFTIGMRWAGPPITPNYKRRCSGWVSLRPTNNKRKNKLTTVNFDALSFIYYQHRILLPSLLTHSQAIKYIAKISGWIARCFSSLYCWVGHCVKVFLQRIMIIMQDRYNTYDLGFKLFPTSA